MLRNTRGERVRVSSEATIYALAGLPFVPPEMREGIGEVAAAEAGMLPELLDLRDVEGALHCHSTWSDGKATIEEMATAAKARGWSYIGITDHSQAAFYAGGLSRGEVLAQHDEIDALNTTDPSFRILKVALELNADPHRLDLDWRLIPQARAVGATLEIGPDAHSVNALDNMAIGVGMARKAGVTRADVLNARPVAEVLAFASARRAGRG